MSHDTIMTSTVNLTGFFQIFFRLKFIPALVLLCWCLLAAGKTAAQEPAKSGDHHLELTLNQLLGEQQAVRYKNIIRADEIISWELYLPDNNSTELPGVLVYVSPRDTGQIDSRWRTVMDQQNLIYISANDSGNSVIANRRIVLANMAVMALGQRYSFDNEGITVAGFSGGGRVASMLASQYPGALTGALYICGVNFWRKDQTPDVERVLQNRYVFLTGSRDFNRNETSNVYRRYLKAGAQYSKLMVVPRMSHEHPDANALTEALQFIYGQGLPQ